MQKDILFGNLETALTSRHGNAEKSVVLSSLPEKARHLSEAPFDILNLANNHIMDCGSLGARETYALLESRNFRCLGLEFGDKKAVPVIIERNAIRIGFLGYDENGSRNDRRGIRISRINTRTILRDIENLRQDCDAIVVSLHWGMEYINYPSPYQIELAHSIIDSGAAVVLGHHPHVLQGIEEYNGGLIAYSLGNFQFEYDISGMPQAGPMKSNQSMILSLEIGKSGLSSYDIIPITIKFDYTPVVSDGISRQAIIDGIKTISAPITEGLINWPQWYALVSETYIADSLRSWRRRIRDYGFRHFLLFCKWLASPFTLRCFFAVMTEKPSWDSPVERSIKIKKSGNTADSHDPQSSQRKEKADALYTV